MHERIAKIARMQKRFADDDSAPYADVLIVADPDSAYGRIDPRMAANEELAIHVKDGGRKTIHLPRSCSKVVDLINDRTVATDCDSFADDFRTPDTKIYETVYK